MNELRDVFTKYKAVVFFDTETTGLEAESCQIIELAAIRVEKTERGTLRMADSADMFVKLPEGERIPQKIVELTGITDEQLENEGITETEAAATRFFWWLTMHSLTSCLLLKCSVDTETVAWKP